MFLCPFDSRRFRSVSLRSALVRVRFGSTLFLRAGSVLGFLAPLHSFYFFSLLVLSSSLLSRGLLEGTGALARRLDDAPLPPPLLPCFLGIGSPQVLCFLLALGFRL